MLKKCILIGGAPLTGKSTLADTLAKETGAVQFSTDNIRDWMQRVVAKNDHVQLFYSHGMDIKTFYDQYDTPQKVVDGEVAQGKDIAKGIIALLQCYLPWKTLILEGIAITPSLSVELQRLFPYILFECKFLYDNNAVRIKERIDQRGLWDLAGAYPDKYKTIELAWVLKYNDYFKAEAVAYNLPLTFIE